MERNNYIYNIILSILSAVIGLLFIVVDPAEFLRLIFVFVGIFVIISALPSLFTLAVKEKSKEENILLVYTIIIVAVGILLITCPYTIAYVIGGIILLVIPLYRIATSIDKIQTLKKEIVKLVLGIILIVGGLGTTIRAILYVLGAVIIALSIAYLIYNAVLLFKLNKKEKKEQKDNEVIDV